MQLHGEHGDPSGAALHAWRRALLELTSGQEEARAWRRSRYRFAHRLGDALVGCEGISGLVTGPVLYGVWLQSGLLYIGQTRNAQRRMRDLPIGESHHLANTFPPETWHRVVIIAWPDLPEATPLPAGLSPDLVGLGLEHRFQALLRPLFNAEHRTTDGGWRDVEWEKKNSQGARAAPLIDDLFEAVHEVWNDAASQGQDVLSLSKNYRVVFPGLLYPEVLD